MRQTDDNFGSKRRPLCIYKDWRNSYLVFFDKKPLMCPSDQKIKKKYPTFHMKFKQNK